MRRKAATMSLATRIVRAVSWMVIGIGCFFGIRASAGERNPASAPSGPGNLAEFAARIARSYEAGPLALDRLWLSASRDSTRRLLDAQAASLFTWTQVKAKVRDREMGAMDPASTHDPRGQLIEGSRSVIDLKIELQGNVVWDPQAYAVARSLWRPMCDEESPEFRVERLEEWRFEESAGEHFKATERVSLASCEIVSAAIIATVFPEEGELLVESDWSLTPQLETITALRFLLDRRVEIYDLQVDGRPVETLRGSELGTVGLEGFSPENESSFRLPVAKRRGETFHILMRTRSPLSHMKFNEGITTLPLHPGPFRERIWIPVWGKPSGGNRTPATVEVRWPRGSFSGIAVTPSASVVSGRSNPADQGATRSRLDDLFDHNISGPCDPRDADFTLWTSGAAPPDSLRPAVGRVARPGTLDPHARSRAAVVEPLRLLSLMSSRDLSSELQDALPLDSDFLEELFDDGATDAESGADDRSAE